MVGGPGTSCIVPATDKIVGYDDSSVDVSQGPLCPCPGFSLYFLFYFPVVDICLFKNKAELEIHKNGIGRSKSFYILNFLHTCCKIALFHSGKSESQKI